MIAALDVGNVTREKLADATRFFDEHGYIPLTGLSQSVAPAFEDNLASTIGVSRDELQTLLSPTADAVMFDATVRQKLSRINTSPELARALLDGVGPIIKALIGPIVHVSSTYHGQFKGGALTEAAKDIATYHNEGASNYMEVHGAYRLHQDFTGASIPTSPSGLTLWVALNECAESTLRIFPGSHRLGLFCHKMWKSDDARLGQLAPPIEIEARPGTGVLFNALAFHGTGKVGKLRRVSCDIRVFPLTGFLPSDVHFLDPRPLDVLRRQRADGLGPTLLAPILEQLAFLGEPVSVEGAAPRSQLNWVNYIVALMQGPADAALPHLTRFINTDLLEDPPTVFTTKFHNRQIHRDRLKTVRERALGAT